MEGAAAVAEQAGPDFIDINCGCWVKKVALREAGAGLLRNIPKFEAVVKSVIAGTRLPEVFTAASLLLVIAIALLMTRIGLSPALGTFLAGVVLANSEYRHELEGDIAPFKGLLLGLFFLAVGASIDFGLVAARPGLVAGLVVGLMAVKFGVLAALGAGFRLGTDQNLLFAFGLCQMGEFAFVLLSFATQQGVLGAEVASPLVAVVALSMALTPLLFLANEKLLQPRLGTRQEGERSPDAIHEDNPVIIAGFGRFGHVVGRLLRANGVGATVLDLDSDRVDLLRKVGLPVFYGDATRPELLRSAGAEKASLLVLALDSPEKTLALVHLVRKHFPHLTVLARATDRSDAYELIDAGVAHVYRETFDTSLRMAVDALRLLGFRAPQAQRASHTFFRHDEDSVRAMAAMRRDHARHLLATRESIADLERLLLAEREEVHVHRDAGWDSDACTDAEECPPDRPDSGSR
jgi:voltage-gated potassium channel Kch